MTRNIELELSSLLPDIPSDTDRLGSKQRSLRRLRYCRWRFRRGRRLVIISDAGLLFVRPLVR